MAQGARVSSLAALTAFKAALQRFKAQADKALCEADVEVQRVSDWLAHDQPLYWQHELKKREGAVAKAKDELRRVQLSIADRPPSAVEQKQALKLAQRRWDEAREKLQIVSRWQNHFDRAINEYRGQAQHVVSAIDSDIPKAIALVERLAASLDEYIAVAAPATEIGKADEGAEEVDAPSMSRATGSARPIHKPTECHDDPDEQDTEGGER